MDNNKVGNPVVAAVDLPDVASAGELLQVISPHIGVAKLGLEFFMSQGPKGVFSVMEESNCPLFLDMKLHDIPNTVGKAVRALQPLRPAMLTVHTLGGEAMLSAAVDEAEDTCLLLGVTVLTSMDQAALSAVGIQDSTEDLVLRLVEIGLKAGLTGFVCSAHEIKPIRQAFGGGVTLVTPGIRPETSDVSDQKRVMTPRQAIEQGADYLVIGRPITAQADPALAAKAIVESIR